MSQVLGRFPRPKYTQYPQQSVEPEGLTLNVLKSYSYILTFIGDAWSATRKHFNSLTP